MVTEKGAPGNGSTPDVGQSKVFGLDNIEVPDVRIGGQEIRVLNPKLIEQWATQNISLSQLMVYLKDKTPAGYRLPTEAEVRELKTSNKEKIERIRIASGIQDTEFNVLTDDGSGITRSSEWSVTDSSISEKHKGVISTEKKELELQLNDLIFFVKAGELPNPQE